MKGGYVELKRYALFGLLGPLVAYVLIGVSIMWSSWFDWRSSALSDLGHPIRSGVAPVFNLGLFLAGFLIIIYSISTLRSYASYTSYCLLVSALMLQLVAVFNEVYGLLHFLVSMLFFTSLGLASVVYAVERRSLLASAALALGLGSWVLFWAGIYGGGVAIPETISSVAVTSWVMSSALKTLLS